MPRTRVNQWLCATRKAPSNEGAFLVSETPPLGSHRGRGTGDGGGVLAESLGKSYAWAVGSFFGNTELSMKLRTKIAGISGFDDLGSRGVALNVEPEVTAERPRPLNGVAVNAAMSGEECLNLQVRPGVVLTAVQQRGVSSSTLLLFAAIVFMVRAVMLMLGPLLVALADDLGTSIAMAGQLAAATFITWGIAAPLVGPISDTYGRRPVLLVGVQRTLPLGNTDSFARSFDWSLATRSGMWTGWHR